MSHSSNRTADAEDGIPRYVSFQRQREDAMPDRGGDYDEPKPHEPKSAGSPPSVEDEDESSNPHRRSWFPQMKCLTFIVLFLVFAIVLGE